MTARRFSTLLSVCWVSLPTIRRQLEAVRHAKR